MKSGRDRPGVDSPAVRTWEGLGLDQKVCSGKKKAPDNRPPQKMWGLGFMAAGSGGAGRMVQKRGSAQIYVCVRAVLWVLFFGGAMAYTTVGCYERPFFPIPVMRFFLRF